MDFTPGFGLAVTIFLAVWGAASGIATLVICAAVAASKGPREAAPPAPQITTPEHVSTVFSHIHEGINI